MNLLDQRVDVLRDEILFALSTSAGRRHGRERFAHVSMDLWGSPVRERWSPHRSAKLPPVIEIALDESPVAGSEIVHVLFPRPRLRRVEKTPRSARSELYRTWTSPNKVLCRTQERMQHYRIFGAGPECVLVVGRGETSSNTETGTDKSPVTRAMAMERY